MLLSRWSDWGDFGGLDRPFVLLDELRRQMDRVWSEYDVGRPSPTAAGRFWSELTDEGSALQLTAVLPGLSDKEIQIRANQDGLTLEAQRTTDVPEGYTVHRRERPSAQVARSWTFPCHVDIEKVTANLTNGILTVTLPKAPESQPRQISVRAG